MRTAGRVLYFVLLCLAAAAGLLGLFPGLKEGFSWEEIPFVAGGAILLIALAVGWWFVCGRRRVWAVVGIVILLPAIYGTVGTTIQYGSAHLRGPWLAERIAIARYAEAPIEWPGFDGPVGLKVEIDISHPEGADGLIYPPELRMGHFIDVPDHLLSATVTSGGGYFKDYHLDEKVGELALLKTVLFDRYYRDREASERFHAGARTTLVYHLFPGTIDLLESPDHLCLDSRSFGIPVCGEGEEAEEIGCRRKGWSRVLKPLYGEGDELSALWFVAGASDMAADLSAALTETLRARSALQGDPAAWRAMQHRLEPASLTAAGYARCPPGPQSHTVSRVCYCRGG